MEAVSDVAQKTLSFRASIPLRVPRKPRYKGTRKARLWRLRAKAIALSLALGAATGGCSMSYKLDSLFGKDQTDQTASLKPAVAPAAVQNASPSDNDLAYAKAAAVAVLGRADKDASEPWSNPETG